jgi:microcystin-dependent protein
MDGEPFLGMIQPFGFGFAPRGWATCSGQLLPISQNQALFSLLGTTYGGDGRTTFALPDLRGRSITHVGTGPGLTPINWGQRSGNEWTYLTANNLPPHNHTGNLVAERALANISNPEGRMLGGFQGYVDPNPANNKNMATGSIAMGYTGASSPFSNRDPYLGVYICIALVGLYPSRN